MNKNSKQLKVIDSSMCALLKNLGFDAYETKPHWTFEANGNMEMMENAYNTFANMNVDYITTNTYHFGSTLDNDLPGVLRDRAKYDGYLKSTCELLNKIVGAHNLKGGHQSKVLGSVGSLATKYHDGSEYNGRYVDIPTAMSNAIDYFFTCFLVFEKNSSIRDLIIETIPTELEGRAILRVLDDFPDLKLVMCFTFKENGLLRHGDNIHQLAEQMQKHKQIVGIGINCTDPKNVLPALEELKPYSFPNVFVYPNIGDEHFQSDEEIVGSPYTPQLVQSWAENGATVIGGCCGVETEHLCALQLIVADYNKKLALSK